MTEMADVERMLRDALAPVEPSEALSDRLERNLSEVADLAAEELADWELATMRDPRNWGPTAAAVVAGSGAAAALVLVRARQRQRRNQATGLAALEQSARDVAGDLRKRLR